MDTSYITAIYQAFAQGGIWMWAIFAVQVVSVAIIAERIFHLYILRAPQQRKIVDQFERDIKSGDLERAAMAKPPMIGKAHAIYAVVNAGAQAAINMGGKEEIQSKMDEILLDENEKLEKRTGFLAMFGNVGTLLGLLGTIVGLIKAFASVSGLDPIEKAARLSEGIAMAMNTTAYGLIMAVPALIMYAVLQNRANRLSSDLNQAALKAYNWLSFNNDQVTSTQKLRVRKG